MFALKLSLCALFASILGFAFGAHIMMGAMAFLFVLAIGMAIERLLSAGEFEDR